MNERTHPGGPGRRGLLTRAARIGAVTIALGSIGGLLAACGQKEEASVALPAGLAKPGETIPKSEIKWAMAPYPDETIAVIGMKQGWFDDVGVKIAPTATGAKFDLTESLAPLLSKQVDVGSGVFEVFASQLDTVQNVRSFVTFDTFEGFGFFASPDSGMKSVAEFQKEGQTFDEAMASAMGQFKGKSVGLATDPAARLFYKICFDLGGLKQSDVDRKDLSNPNIVSSALAGKLDVPAPSGGSEIIKLRTEGFKTIIDERELLAKSKDARRLQLVTHGTYTTSDDFYKQNYETTLRAASVVYRVLDQLRRDHPKASTYQLPFLNAYTGTKLGEPELAQIHKTIAVLRTFDEMGEFYESKGPNNIYLSAQAQINQLVKDGVLKNPHSPAEIEGGKRVWEDLKRYRALSDKLFKAIDDPEDPLVKKARAQYVARNYLDSYRFLAAKQAQS